MDQRSDRFTGQVRRTRAISMRGTALSKRGDASRVDAAESASASPSAGSTAAGTARAAPPARARPVSLESSRADLLKCLAQDPAVSRSVGLVR